MPTIYLVCEYPYEDRTIIHAAVARRDDAEKLRAMIEPPTWSDVGIEEIELDDPAILDRLATGRWVWVVRTFPDNEGWADIAPLGSDPEPMRPVGAGFTGYIEAASAEEAMALGKAEVAERGLQPERAMPTFRIKFDNFSAGDTPFIDSFPPPSDRLPNKVEWGAFDGGAGKPPLTD